MHGSGHSRDSDIPGGARGRKLPRGHPDLGNLRDAHRDPELERFDDLQWTDSDQADVGGFQSASDFGFTVVQYGAFWCTVVLGFHYSRVCLHDL